MHIAHVPVPYHKMSFKSRAYLESGGSKAKYRENFAGDIQKRRAPRNLDKNAVRKLDLTKQMWENKVLSVKK